MGGRAPDLSEIRPLYPEAYGGLAASARWPMLVAFSSALMPTDVSSADLSHTDVDVDLMWARTAAGGAPSAKWWLLSVCPEENLFRFCPLLLNLHRLEDMHEK